MKFFAFHLMPWDRLPADFATKYESAWTWLPNSIYEPEHGHELYNRYLDELVLADELGFDGVCVNEHHQNAYGTMPSPNLMGAILARQTKRVKIAVIGNALPLYNPPTRVAEEFAMIDVISGGRLIAGLVVGGGPEYYSFTINPTFARSMYAEAVDLVIRAWTEPGPFEHYGKHWKLKYVNPWPRPLQKPHPPIWIPGAGSKETIEFVAARRWSYMGIPYFHIDFFQRNFDLFRQCAQKNGYTADPEQLGWLLPIYVAETDERAWEEYEKHLWYFARNLLKGLTVLPPGYTSAQSIAVISKAKEKFLSSVTTRKQVEDGAYAVVGSPATVRDRLKAHIQKLGVGNLLGLFQLGSLPADLTKKNMTMFAQEVLPTLRKELQPEMAKQHMPEIANQTDFITIAGKKTQVMRGGKGPPLVYLHSAGGEMDWTAFHDGLAKQFSVIAPAHPGFSLSEGLDQINDIHDLVWHYVDLFEHFDLHGVPVVGFSLGAWLGVELAILRPELVKKLVMVNAAGLHVPDAPMGEFFIDDLDKLAQLLFYDPKCSAVAEAMPTSFDDMRILMFLRAREATARVGWSPYLHDPKLPQHLHRVRCPTLVIWGRDDKLIPLAHGQYYAKHIAGGRLEVIDRCGHMLPFEKPEEFVRLTTAFVR